MKKRRHSLRASLIALVFSLICSLSFAETASPQAPLTLADLASIGATVHSHDGRVTFVDGPCTADPVKSVENAAAVVDAMVPLLGGDARTQFEPWRTLTDTAGNVYYVFRQMLSEVTVSGGAVKVVTNAEGRMLGLVGSVESDLPEAKASEGIPAEQAEAMALQHMQEAQQGEADLITGRTEKIILPVNLEINPEMADDKLENRYVWAVYTTNPSGNVARGSDLPYLAHYVTMDGEYLYILPTILTGDEAGASGFNSAYVFEFMEPAEYTGEVRLSDGSTKAITVTLMRDVRTGMYYLGNIERRIAVADCYNFVYNNGRVVLEASADNTGWDDICLLSFYHYCMAWDNYKELGWMGGDGLGTPILILKDYCNRDHEPINNAAYAAQYYGWQVFLSSSANDLAQCLDVLAHEFTHCVTGSVMTYNAYMNDYGAINEAMSDIQGNLCEMIYGATEDTTWELGENSSVPVRSMSDPHKFGQPEYTWDLHYVPKVKTPTQTNDRGGVHTNSSLLNNVAYRLCENGGMPLKDARAYWFAVDCSMVPGTDYEQLSELLPWVLKNLGKESYLNALEAAMDATRIRSDDIPDTFDQDRALVTLTLPDNEQFGDGNWSLLIVSVNAESIMHRVDDLLHRRGEYADALVKLADILGLDPSLLPTAEEIEADPQHAWDRIIPATESLAEEFKGMDSEDGNTMDREKTERIRKLRDWVTEVFGGTVYSGTGAAGQDGRTVRLVCTPGRTLPVLFRMEFDSDLHIKSAGLAAYTFGSWFDLSGVIEAVISQLESGANAEPSNEENADLSWLSDILGNDSDASGANAEEQEPDLSWLSGLFGSGDTEDQPPALLSSAMDVLGSMDWVWDLVFFNVKPGAVSVIPDSGLDMVTMVDMTNHPDLQNLLLTGLTGNGSPEKGAP